MAVKKAKNGTWMFDIRHPITKRRKRVVGFPRREDADQARSILIEGWRNEKFGTTTDYASRRVHIDLIAELKVEAELVKAESVDYFTERNASVGYYTLRILPKLPKTLNIWHFGEDHIERLIQYERSRGVKPRSISTYMSLLHTALERIKVRVGAPLANWKIPTVKVTGAVHHGGKLRRIWSPGELEKVLDALANPPADADDLDVWKDTYDFLLIAAMTGMRRSEVLFLTWDKIFFNWNIIQARTLKQRSEVYRDLPMIPELKEHLLSRRQHILDVYGEGENNVFPRWAVNQKAWWIYRTLKKAAIIAGVEYGQGEMGVVPHGLRHTAATQLLLDGADLTTAADILGTTVETMLKNYAHTTMESKRKAASSLAVRRRAA